MFFPKHVNMAQHMKRFIIFKNMYLLSLHNYICKSSSLGPKNLGREGKNEIKHILRLEFA